MSDAYETDGGNYVESIRLGLGFSQWYHGLVFEWYMMILWVDMIDHEQYIHGRLEAPVPRQSRPRDEAIL